MPIFPKPNRYLLIGLLGYMVLAVSSSAGGGGGGGGTPPACNETTVSLTIRINWGAITTYQHRNPGCAIPSQMSSLPSTSTCNSPSTNTLTKGIVEVTIRLADDNSCTLAKAYTTRQYFTTAGNDDIVSEVPQKSLRIDVKYYEECTACTLAVTGNSRAVYTSITIVPEAQVTSGGLIQLAVPTFLNAVTTSNCF